MKYPINDLLLKNSSAEEDLTPGQEFPTRLHSLISDSSEALTKCLQFREKHKKILGKESQLGGLEEEDSWAYDDDMSSTVFESEVVDRPQSPVKPKPVFSPYLPKRPVTPEKRYTPVSFGEKRGTVPSYGLSAPRRSPPTRTPAPLNHKRV